MEKKTIWVNGMSCNHCVMSIEKALKNMGVNAAVNLNEKTVVVEFDPAKVTLDKIAAEIEDQGYDVVK